MKKVVLNSILGTALVATTTTAIVVPIEIAKIATKKTKDLLSNFVPLGGPVNSLAERLNDPNSDHKGKLNYLAIGDSITAGNNEYMQADDLINPGNKEGHSEDDYLSFADFIANDLAKAHKLNDYRNFAVTGDRIPEQRAKIFRDPAALKATQKADLISISLGANDLLAAVEVLNISFNALRGESQLNTIAALNSAREKLTSILDLNSASRPDGRHREASPSGYASVEDIKHLVKESFDKLQDMLSRGTLSGLLDIEQELLDNIFKLIKADMMTFVSEVHAAAPKAKIVVMGYAYPFHLLPESLQNQVIKIRDNNGNLVDKTIDGKPATLKNVFGQFINTLSEAIEKANYTKFININDFKEFSSKADEVTYTLAGVTPQVVTRSEWERVMPNPFDIHPSTYGHQVIAGHMYEWMLKDMGINAPTYESVQKLTDQEKISKLEEVYTYTTEELFKIQDETIDHDAHEIVNLLQMIDKPGVLKTIGSFIEQLDGDKIAEKYQDLLKMIQNLDLSNKDNLDKIVELLNYVIKADSGSMLLKIVNAIDTKGLSDAYPEILKTIKNSNLTMADKLNAALGLAPMLVKQEYQSFIVSVIGTYSNLIDTNKLVDNFDKLSSAFSENKNINQSVSELFDVLIDSAADQPFGNVPNFKVTDFFKGLKSIVGSIDLTKFTGTFSEAIMGFTEDGYKANTIKGAEALLGAFIYIASDASRETSDNAFIGVIDKSTDQNADALKTIFSGLLNGLPLKATSLSETIATYLFATPILSGGFKLQTGEIIDPNSPSAIKLIAKLYDETVEVTKTLGLDISGALSSSQQDEQTKFDWMVELLQGPSNKPDTPRLVSALRAIGLS